MLSAPLLLSVAALCTLLLLTVMLIACGVGSSSSSSNNNNNNGGGNGGGTVGAPLGTNTPAGTYTVIVNAVSGSFRSSTSVQLTIQ